MVQRDQDLPPHVAALEAEAASLAGEGVDEANEVRKSLELQAITAEIDSIKASVAHIAESTSHYLKRRVAENSTDLIAENPVRAALWAALAGFVIGRLSR